MLSTYKDTVFSHWSPRKGEECVLDPGPIDSFFDSLRVFFCPALGENPLWWLSSGRAQRTLEWQVARGIRQALGVELWF